MRNANCNLPSTFAEKFRKKETTAGDNMRRWLINILFSVSLKDDLLVNFYQFFEGQLNSVSGMVRNWSRDGDMVFVHIHHMT